MKMITTTTSILTTLTYFTTSGLVIIIGINQTVRFLFLFKIMFHQVSYSTSISKSISHQSPETERNNFAFQTWCRYWLCVRYFYLAIDFSLPASCLVKYHHGWLLIRSKFDFPILFGLVNKRLNVHHIWDFVSGEFKAQFLFDWIDGA